nr:unnamed protein product [Callosobruchus analis]CAI5869281.1 unnamed protein product [Callosobruchus analis]
MLRDMFVKYRLFSII